MTKPLALFYIHLWLGVLFGWKLGIDMHHDDFGRHKFSLEIVLPPV